MPFVGVLHKPYLDDHELDALSVMLPQIVSEVLTIKGDRETKLTVTDIVVRFEALGPRDKMADDMELVIDASDYPSRDLLRDELADEICKRALQYLSAGRALGVYLKLVKAGWREGRKM